jgi:hypothetical protein
MGCQFVSEWLEALIVWRNQLLFYRCYSFVTVRRRNRQTSRPQYSTGTTFYRKKVVRVENYLLSVSRLKEEAIVRNLLFVKGCCGRMNVHLID